VSSSFDLNGKVALVTGSSSGIGRATAEALAANGARVAINFHRNEAGANTARAQITGAGGSAIVIQADVTQANEVESLVEQTVAEFGPIDILVNNAGSLIERLKILELTEERWDEVIDLNLKSAFLCCKAVAGSMMERKTGTLINVSSIAGRNGGALGSIHYSTAKGGLITLRRSGEGTRAFRGTRKRSLPGVIDTPTMNSFRRRR
jgi:3-oxoacyl-[acyl-carrier protein] reductase